MPGENLTRTEASARSAVLRVEHYDVTLDLTTGPDTFGSRTVVRFASTDPGGSSFADLIAPRVDAVALNGRQLDPGEVFRDSRIRLDDLHAVNELAVDAVCAYMPTDEGLHRFVDPVDDNPYLWTQFETADARRVFAAFEQPDLKAGFTLHVTTPDGWTVVSNAATPDPVPTGTASLRWDFPATERISTYLLAVVAGPYHRVSRTWTGAAAQIPMSWLCRQSLAQFLDVDELFALTQQGLAFFESRFATPYPFSTYDQVMIPEYGGAMEHPGCVTHTEDFVFRSRESVAGHATRAMVLLHEMAHMWFGDLVTMRWWEDLWLNESFAEWAAHWATAGATRYTDAWVDFALGQGYAYRADQLSSTHPVAGEVVDLAAAESIFDGITYGKGAAVLRQLVAWVGEDAFLAGLHTYFADHAYANAEFADLLRALEAASGRPLLDWATAWLSTAGVNTLRLRASVDEAGRYDTFAIEQSAAPDHPTLRPHHLAVGLFVLERDGAGTARLVRGGRVELDVEGARTDVPQLLGEPAADLVLLNDGDLTYAKARLDERSLAALAVAVDTLDDPSARVAVWIAAWNATRDAELSTTAWLGLVLRGLPTETHPATLETVCAQTTTAVGRYTDPATRDATAVRWADALCGLALTAVPGSDDQLVLVRALAGAAAGDRAPALLAAQLDGTDVLPGLEVDTDLRWRLLTGLTRAGRAGADAVDAELRRDPTSTGERDAAAASAAMPDRSAKQRAWRDAVERTDLAATTQAAVMRRFWQPDQSVALDGYLDRWFDEAATIRDRVSTGAARTFLLAMFPAVLASPDLVERTRTFLERPGLDPSTRRYVGQQLDDVVRAVAAQACDRAATAG